MGSGRSRKSTRARTARSAIPPSEAMPHSPGAQSNAETGEPKRRGDIPLEVIDMVEEERRRLRQASALLSCLKIAAMYQEWHEEIDAGDVAETVQDLVDRVINRLDLIALAKNASDLDALGATERALTEAS